MLLNIRYPHEEDCILTLCMMLAGCTGVILRNQQNSQIIGRHLHGCRFGLYVDMNADDTYVVYTRGLL